MAIFNIYRDRENSPKNAYFCKIINYTGVKVARKKNLKMPPRKLAMGLQRIQDVF